MPPPPPPPRFRLSASTRAPKSRASKRARRPQATTSSFWPVRAGFLPLISTSSQWSNSICSAFGRDERGGEQSVRVRVRGQGKAGGGVDGARRKSDGTRRGRSEGLPVTNRHPGTAVESSKATPRQEGQFSELEEENHKAKRRHERVHSQLVHLIACSVAMYFTAPPQQPVRGCLDRRGAPVV